MDENEGSVGSAGGHVEGGGDSNEKLHPNEAIPAVVDEGFLGEEEEEDDDYEDLYNDVNVSEGFLQSMRENEDVGFRNEQEVEKKLELTPAVSRPLPPPPQVSVDDSGAGVRIFENDDGGSMVPGRVDSNISTGVRVSEVSGRGSGDAAGGGFRVELGQTSSKAIEDERVVNHNGIPNQGMGQQQLSVGGVGTAGNVGNLVNAGVDGFARQVGGNMNGNVGNGYGNGTGSVGMIGGAVGGGGGGGGGGTLLFVGDLHWWTTDAELESELCKYGHVKEVKFFDEKASGKSKGYCQVEFFDPSAATACMEGMNGHVFNGRACVVAYASPFSVKRMGEAQVNRSQQMSQGATSQTRRGPGDVPVKPGGDIVPTGASFQGGGENNNRGFGRGNWGGRGNAQGMGGRGPGGPMRNRGGGMGGRGFMGNGGNGFGQGIGGTPPMLHPQTMMGQGFDPSFGGPMVRMGNYGGFPGAPTPPFSGMMSPFPPVGNVGLPGVAHVNPAFFGRGMPMNGMGMMPNAGVDGPNMGMWSDPNMGGWGGEDHGGRGGESSYGEEAASDHQYGEVGNERGPWLNAIEKDRGAERDWSGSSDRRYREGKEPGYDRDIPREKDDGQDHEWPERKHRDESDNGRERDRDRARSRDRERDRDRHRDDRDRYADHHRYREREPEYEDEWEKGRSSRTHSRSRLARGEEQRSRSKDADYGKRRRITSE